ncbi:hypothetical protein D3C78_1351270 [compost metagenome]
MGAWLAAWFSGKGNPTVRIGFRQLSPTGENHSGQNAIFSCGLLCQSIQLFTGGNCSSLLSKFASAFSLSLKRLLNVIMLCISRGFINTQAIGSPSFSAARNADRLERFLATITVFCGSQHLIIFSYSDKRISILSYL